MKCGGTCDWLSSRRESEEGWREGGREGGRGKGEMPEINQQSKGNIDMTRRSKQEEGEARLFRAIDR